MDMTDMGLAERFREATKQWLRYCDQTDQWFCWTGSRWRIDDNQVRFQVAKAMIAALEDEISAIEDDKKRKDAFGQWYARRSHAKLKSLLSTLASENGIATRISDWDADKYALQTPAGIVDLRTGELRPATQDDLMHRCTAVAPDRDAKPQRWLKFLEEITKDRRDLQEYIRRAIGMTLVGVQREQVILLCSGIGSNGKSKLIETLVEMLGDYAGLAMPNLLSAKSHDAHPTELMALEGRRLVYCDEVKDNRLDESKVKRMTGGRQITARGIAQNPRTFDVEFTIWADCNEKPVISGTDEGIWRRIRLLPFEAHFTAETRDPFLGDKLRDEMPGILAWAIDAAVDFLKLGLCESLKVSHATAEYRSEQDILKEFVDSCCFVHPDAIVASADIYKAVTAYLESIGFRPWSRRKCTSELTKRGTIQRDKLPGGTRALKGIKLKDNWRMVLGLYSGSDNDDQRYG